MKDHFHIAIVQTKPNILYFHCQPSLWIETLLSGVVAIFINGYFSFYAKDIKLSYFLYLFCFHKIFIFLYSRTCYAKNSLSIFSSLMLKLLLYRNQKINYNIHC